MKYFIYPIDMKIYEGEIIDNFRYMQQHSPFNILITLLYRNSNIEDVNVNKFINEYYENLKYGNCTLMPDRIEAYMFDIRDTYVVPTLIVSNDKSNLTNILNIAYEIYYLTRDNFEDCFYVHGFNRLKKIQEKSIKYIINKTFR